FDGRKPANETAGGDLIVRRGSRQCIVALAAMNTPTVLVMTAALLVGANARAQESIRLGLDDAVSRAIQVSHRLAEIDARRTASMAAVQVHSAADRPLVSLQAGYTRTNHIDAFTVPNFNAGGQLIPVYADVPDNGRTRIDLQWPIYTGGR